MIKLTNCYNTIIKHNRQNSTKKAYWQLLLFDLYSIYKITNTSIGSISFDEVSLIGWKRIVEIAYVFKGIANKPSFGGEKKNKYVHKT